MQAWRTHALKLFVLLFGRAAFLPDHRGETFHQLALREGKQWEARVARDLSDTVFDYVFPALGQALAGADGKPAAALDAAALDEVREGALILLYRLLFVLYAEDRNLLARRERSLCGLFADEAPERGGGEEGARRPVLRSHESLLVPPRWRVPGDRPRRRRPRHPALQWRPV